MNVGILYMILPIVIRPFTQVMLARSSRSIGSIKTTIFRQLSIFIVWFPILIIYGIPEWSSISLSLHNIIFSSFFGSIMILSAMYGTTLLPIMASRIVMDATRVTLAVLFWYFLLWEHISYYDVGWIILLAVWFYLFWLKNIDVSHLHSKNTQRGIALWVMNGFLFTFNMYFFRKYSLAMSPILAWYILEVMNWVFVFIYGSYFSYTHEYNHFEIKKSQFLHIFWLSPLLLLAVYGLSKANQSVPFYVSNMSFVFMLFTSMLFSHIYLGEKLPKKQLFPLSLIVIGLLSIILI